MAEIRMGKGSYRGGSTIIRPGSDWFSYSEAEPLQAAPLKKSDPFKEAFQRELSALQNSPSPEIPSGSRERQERHKELKRRKKQEKAEALKSRIELLPEEQRALGEARKWAKVAHKFRSLNAKVFKTPAD